MSVQYSAVTGKPPLYIVLYCLTQARIHRYSSLNLCPPYPAWGENNDGTEDTGIKLDAAGIRLVNSQDPHFSRTEHARNGALEFPCLAKAARHGASHIWTFSGLAGQMHDAF